jgi:uncharacterized protein YcbX
MKGLELTQAECTETGLKLPAVELYDRRWMLAVGDENRFVTARQKPTLLTAQLSLDGEKLCIDPPNMVDPLILPLIPDVRSLQRDNCRFTKVWGQTICGWDCGEEAAEWFSRFLNEGQHRLLYNPGVDLRAIERKPHLYVNTAKPNDKIAYHDDGPFLVVSSSSLDDVNSRLTQQGSDATALVTAEYFRPSITVSGDSPAFDEDNWSELFIGDVKMTTLMPCARCMLTTIDPIKGEIRKDGEPLKTLRSYRMIQPNNDSPCFGTYFVCDRPGTIRLGDPVYAYRHV